MIRKLSSHLTDAVTCFLMNRAQRRHATTSAPPQNWRAI